MAYYQHWLTRFVLRKDVLRRIRMRLRKYERRLLKDEVDDLAFLLDGRSPTVIFDCGANVGFVTHTFRKRFPAASVYAFEPNPVVFERLAATYAADHAVKPVCAAISRAPGVLAFNQNANTGTSSFFEPTAYNRRFYARDAEQVEVEVTTIDAFATAHGIDHIDILKLDLEGSERDALLGAAQLLAEERIDIVYTEIAVVPLYKGQPLLEDLLAVMRENGYSLYNLYGFNESAVRQAVIGNATFISPRFRAALAEQWGAENCGW